MKIRKENLEKYRGFIEINSTDGNYDTNKGLVSLLSSVSPDPKVSLLLSMESGQTFYGPDELYDALVDYLHDSGLSRNFPLTKMAVWSYIERVYKGEKIGGSLVSMGAVNEVLYPVNEDLMSAYNISDAGRDLAIPLGFASMEFIYRAQMSKVPHKFDSMYKTIGTIQSTNEKKRPLVVYNLVKFFVEHSGWHRHTDIKKALDGNNEEIDKGVLTRYLDSLGGAGIIDYESPKRDLNGKRPKGWSTYVVDGKKLLEEDNTTLIGKLIQSRPYLYYPAQLNKIIDFIRNNQDLSYECNGISEKLKIPMSHIPGTLVTLSDIGLLRNESGFIGGKIESRTRGNELTRMIWEILLSPAYHSASTLSPIDTNYSRFDREKHDLLLSNYQEERVHIGLAGGQEIRDAILNLLAHGEEMKRSHIYNEVKGIIRRDINQSSLRRHLLNLTKQGKIQNGSKFGYFSMAPCHDQSHNR